MDIATAQSNLMQKRAALGVSNTGNVSTLKPVNNKALIVNKVFPSSISEQEIEEYMLSRISGWDATTPERPYRSCLCLARHETYEEAENCQCPFCESERAYQLSIFNKKLRMQRENPEPVLSSWGVPRGYLSKSFDNFEGAEAIKNTCIEASRKGHSVLLHGGPGSGKTHLAISMLRQKITRESKLIKSSDERNRRYEDSVEKYFARWHGVFIGVPELLLEVRATFQKDADATEQEVIEKYSKVPLLILDDMGAERGTQWTESTLYLVIDARDKNGLWTVITTNLSLKEIEQIHGARIASRLSNMRIINVKLPDYRRKRFQISGALCH